MINRKQGKANLNGPGQCATCEHPRRAIIEACLRNESVSLRGLGKRYGISAPALYRHRVNHMGIARAITGRMPKGPGRRALAHA